MSTKLIYKESELPQGSEEWLHFRSFGLGGSEIACLMGANLWKDYTHLWEIKTGVKGDDFQTNEAIEKGKRLEPVAREDYEKRYGRKMEPVCMLHPKYPWMRTSLDGLSEDGKIILEIKVPFTKENHLRQTEGGKIPSWRYPQMQHQIAVVSGHYDVERVDYYSYIEDGDPICIPVYPDWEYIQELIRREEIFFGYIERKEQPTEEMFQRPRIQEFDGKFIAKRRG
jgi:putative phage-type endonuclease